MAASRLGIAMTEIGRKRLNRSGQHRPVNLRRSSASIKTYGPGAVSFASSGIVCWHPLSIVSENGIAIPRRAWFLEESAHLPPLLNMRRIPMRSIPVRWNLLGVVLIAIVIYGGTGLVRVYRAGETFFEPPGSTRS